MPGLITQAEYDAKKAEILKACSAGWQMPSLPFFGETRARHVQSMGCLVRGRGASLPRFIWTVDAEALVLANCPRN